MCGDIHGGSAAAAAARGDYLYYTLDESDGDGEGERLSSVAIATIIVHFYTVHLYWY